VYVRAFDHPLAFCLAPFFASHFTSDPALSATAVLSWLLPSRCSVETARHVGNSPLSSSRESLSNALGSAELTWINYCSALVFPQVIDFSHFPVGNHSCSGVRQVLVVCHNKAPSNLSWVLPTLGSVFESPRRQSIRVAMSLLRPPFERKDVVYRPLSTPKLLAKNSGQFSICARPPRGALRSENAVQHDTCTNSAFFVPAPFQVLLG